MRKLTFKNTKSQSVALEDDAVAFYKTAQRTIVCQLAWCAHTQLIGFSDLKVRVWHAFHQP